MLLLSSSLFFSLSCCCHSRSNKTKKKQRYILKINQQNHTYIHKNSLSLALFSCSLSLSQTHREIYINAKISISLFRCNYERKKVSLSLTHSLVIFQKQRLKSCLMLHHHHHTPYNRFERELLLYALAKEKGVRKRERGKESGRKHNYCLLDDGKKN